MDNGCWNVVAFESVILPPHSEGLVIGKIKGGSVARVVSRVLTPENLSKLKGQQEDCRNNEIRTGDALPIKKSPLEYGSIDFARTFEG
jgi:hypothetical protein